MFFGIRPQTNPYLGYPGTQPQMPGQQMQMPPQGQPLQQPQQGGQMSPMLQQLMQNPAFLARLQQMQGTGLGGMQPRPGGFGQPPGMKNIQPISTGAQSLR